MPVQLRSISGKVDDDVEQMLQEIVVAISQLEANALPEAQVVVPAGGVEVGEQPETKRVAVDRQAITDLEADVGVVTPSPVPGVAPSNHLDLVVSRRACVSTDPDACPGDGDTGAARDDGIPYTP